MGLADVKNDIKTLFLVLNSVCLLASLYAISNGVATAVVVGAYDGATVAVSIVIGLLMLAFVLLGYIGAIKEHRIVLIVYSVLMSLFVIIGVVAMAIVVNNELGSNYRRNNKDYRLASQSAMLSSVTLTLCVALVTVAAIAVAGVLASQARRQDPRNQGCVLSPPRPA